MTIARRIHHLLHRFVHERSGNVAIIAAIAMPILVVFCGFGGDACYWYYRQRVIQAAADIAAYNATVALRSGASQQVIDNTALQAATQNGWQSAIGTITVNTPPTSGTHQNAQSVEVLLTENEPRFFTTLFTKGTVPENTRAVATFTYAKNACMLALDKNVSGAMTFWGNADANFTDCNIVSNSLASDSFQVGGAASVITPCARSAGGDVVDASLTLTDCTNVVTNAPQANDPYANLPPPPIPDDCTASATSGDFVPGKYCGGLSINGTANFASGIYVIDGGTFKINANAIVAGSDVMFYLTDGATLSFNGSATLNLSAPTTGTYAGILFYGDRSQPNATNTINGNATSQLTGAIYFPSQEVRFLGNFSGLNGCSQVVAEFDLLHRLRIIPNQLYRHRHGQYHGQGCRYPGRIGQLRCESRKQVRNRWHKVRRSFAVPSGQHCTRPQLP